MKLSIIIPIYNVEKYIQRCLESVMTQKTDSFDVECLLIDDCTPDNSMDIAKEMVNNYQGKIEFIFLKHQQNKGLSETRNTGIRNATGDFVLFIDSDDYLMPDSLTCMMEAKKQHPNADIIIGNVYEQKYKKEQYHINKAQYIQGGKEVRQWMLTHEFAISAWNKLFNRKFLIDNDLFFEPGILHEDVPWTFILYTKISSILLIPEVTYYYWYNDDSISNAKRPNEKTVKSLTAGCRILLCTPYESALYVDQHLYIYRWLLNAINASRYCLSTDTIVTLYGLRAKFMRETLSSFRLVLAVFFLSMYHPFIYVFRIKLFRRYFNQLSYYIGKLARLFDFIHT